MPLVPSQDDFNALLARLAALEADEAADDAEVVALKATIAALTAENTALDARLDALEPVPTPDPVPDPVPLPRLPETSLDGTRGVSIVDDQLRVWTLQQPDGLPLRDGVYVGTGYGFAEFMWKSGTVFGLTTGSTWYAWTGSGWLEQSPDAPTPVPVPMPSPAPAVVLRPFSVSAVQSILESKRDSRLVGKVCSFGDSLTATRAYRRPEAPLSPADLTTFDWMHGRETGDANGFTLAGGEAITARSGAGWGDSWIDAALANPRVTDSQCIDWLFNSVPTIDLVKQRCDQTTALGAVPIIWTVPPRVAPNSPDYDATVTEPHNARLRAFCDAEGIPCIDLYAAFVANPNWRTELVDEGGMHLTRAGYDFRTRLLVQMVGEVKRLAIDTLPAPAPPLVTVEVPPELAALPLIQAQPGPNAVTMKYKGALRVPSMPYREETKHDTFDYGWQGGAYSSSRKSLFLAGHVQGYKLAEISLPEPVDGPFESLPVAELKQGFVDPTNGGAAATVGDGYLGGILALLGKIAVSYYVRYDAAPPYQRLTHWILDDDLSKVAVSVKGPRQIGDGRGGLYSGYMCHIPEQWQAFLGFKALTGNCGLSIVDRTSHGPCAAGINGEDLLRDGPAPSRMFVGAPLDHRTYGYWGERNDEFWSSVASIAGIVFPEGTRTILMFGVNGTGDHCYGYATPDRSKHQTPFPGVGKTFIDAQGNVQPADEQGFSFEHCNWCWDPDATDRDPGGKGPHANPVRFQMWAFDALDFAAVAQGKKNYYDVRPYAVWPIDIPFTHATSNSRGHTLTWDSDRRQILLSSAFSDPIGNSCPLMRVYELV